MTLACKMSGHVCMCVLRISILHLSAIFLLDYVIVPIVWYFMLLYFLGAVGRGGFILFVKNMSTGIALFQSAQPTKTAFVTRQIPNSYKQHFKYNNVIP